MLENLLISKPTLHKVASYLPAIMNQLYTVVAEPASMSSIRQVRTLPPIEPVYRKKAMATLKKALRKGKVADSSDTSASNKKQAEKKECKREVKEGKKQQSWSRKKQTVTSWLEKKLGSSTKLQNSLEDAKAKEHSKVAELHKRISEMQQKRNARQKELLKLTKNDCEESKPQVKKLKRSLRATDRKLRKLNAEVQTLEEKLHQLTYSTPPHISERVQASSDNRAVSDTNTTLTRKGPQVITATSGPQVTSISCKAQHLTDTLPPRPSTAVRIFLLPPDKTTVTPRERMVREMLKVEQRAQEAMFKRPRAAHPSRVRSRIENIQEFLPYDLEHFDDSDTEDEEPMRLTRNVGMEGMRRFEQLQNAKARNATRSKRYSVSISEVAETETDEEFEFVQESMAPCVRPPTRCTNGMAKQMLSERIVESLPLTE